MSEKIFEDFFFGYDGLICQSKGIFVDSYDNGLIYLLNQDCDNGNCGDGLDNKEWFVNVGFGGEIIIFV